MAKTLRSHAYRSLAFSLPLFVLACAPARLPPPALSGDTAPPTLEIVEPTSGSTITTSTPKIIVEYRDEGSGINYESFKVLINGEVRTQDFNLYSNGAEAQVRQGRRLLHGRNEMIVEIKDRAGNLAKTRVVFTNVSEEDLILVGRIIDEQGVGIKGARVSIPDWEVSSKSQEHGNFKLYNRREPLVGSHILSAYAEGYLPFSTLLNFKIPSKERLFIIRLQSLSDRHIVIDTAFHHLGDDSFTPKSAHAGSLRTRAEGTEFSKDFYLGKIGSGRITLKVGTVVGIDAHTGASVYINGKFVGRLANGTGQSIDIPRLAVKAYNENLLSIVSNVDKRSNDYDDFEFINLVLELSP